MTEEASLQFDFKKINEKRDYILEKVKHNDLMSKKI